MRKAGWGKGSLRYPRSGCAAGRGRIPLVFLAGEAGRDRDHRGPGFRRATVSA